MAGSLAPRVVLAELAPTDKRQAATALRKRNYDVTLPRDAKSLVASMEQSVPEVVLVDFAFDTDLSGLLERIRRVAPGVPVIVLSAKANAQQAFQLADVSAAELKPAQLAPANLSAAHLAVADVILKPFIAQELAFRVERCIQAGRQARTAALRSAAERGELFFSPPMLSLAEPVPAAPVPMAGPGALRDPENGRLDAKRVAEFLDVPLSQLAQALGENYKAIHKTPSKASLQPKLLPIERVIATLGERIGDRGRTRAWLNTPHPDLAGRTALDVILAGDATAVSDMLEAAAAGLPS